MRIEMVADHFGVHHAIWTPADGSAVRYVTALWSDRRWWFYIDGEKFRTNFATVEDGARAVADHLGFGEIADQVASRSDSQAEAQSDIPADNRARQLQMTGANSGKLKRSPANISKAETIRFNAIRPERGAPPTVQHGQRKPDRGLAGRALRAAAPDGLMSLLMILGVLLSIHAVPSGRAPSEQAPETVQAMPVTTVANTVSPARPVGPETATTGGRVAKGAGELLFPAAHASAVDASAVDASVVDASIATTGEWRLAPGNGVNAVLASLKSVGADSEARNGRSIAEYGAGGADASALIALPTRKPASAPKPVRLARLDASHAIAEIKSGSETAVDSSADFAPLADHPSRARFVVAAAMAAETASDDTASGAHNPTLAVLLHEGGENQFGDIAGFAEGPPLPVRRIRLAALTPDRKPATAPETVLVSLIDGSAAEPSPPGAGKSGVGKSGAGKMLPALLPARKFTPPPARSTEQPRPRRLLQAARQPVPTAIPARPARRQSAPSQAWQPKAKRAKIAPRQQARTVASSETASRKQQRRAAARREANRKAAAQRVSRNRAIASREAAQQRKVRKVVVKSPRSTPRRRVAARAVSRSGSMISRTVRRDMRGRRYVELRFRRARTKDQYRALQQQRNHAIAQLLRRNRARRSYLR